MYVVWTDDIGIVFVLEDSSIYPFKPSKRQLNYFIVNVSSRVGVKTSLNDNHFKYYYSRFIRMHWVL